MRLLNVIHGILIATGFAVVIVIIVWYAVVFAPALVHWADCKYNGPTCKYESEK